MNLSIQGKSLVFIWLGQRSIISYFVKTVECYYYSKNNEIFLICWVEFMECDKYRYLISNVSQGTSLFVSNLQIKVFLLKVSVPCRCLPEGCDCLEGAEDDLCPADTTCKNCSCLPDKCDCNPLAEDPDSFCAGDDVCKESTPRVYIILSYLS